MEMLEEFFKFLKTHNLPFRPDKPVLLAVSGGLDSCVMVELFSQAGISFAIAHANFKLRGLESDQDEQFVQALAARMNVVCFTRRFDTQSSAEEHGWSTQMAARNLRYVWFRELVEDHGFSGVCTAHHANDALETALFNFTRVKQFEVGSDFSGLLVFRPVLFAGRKDLEQFAAAVGVSWREDSSNDKDDYARNLIRHMVIPVLETLNPNLLDTAARNMRRIHAADRNLEFLLKKFVQLEQGGGKLNKHQLAQLPSPRQALRQLLKQYGFDAEQTRQMADQLEHTGLQWESSKGFKALMDREHLLLQPLGMDDQDLPLVKIMEDDLMLRLPDDTRICLIHTDKVASGPAFDPDPFRAEVDASTLRFPLHLRRWQPGDTFKPLGMGGKHQKLQDFFTNQKISRLEKEKTWILTNQDGSIIWIVGLRLDERFKIKTSTKKICNIQWIK
jgi:tRNA(Ile)-lysidine synthase